MGRRPLQPELNRPGRTTLDPDRIETELGARRPKPPGRGDDDGGPVPTDNQPGHHPEREQDKPDPEAFVARFSGDHTTDGAIAAHGTATDTADDPTSDTADDTEPPAGPPLDHLLHELGDRIRQRDLVLLATYPIHVTVELLRYGRDRVLALR